MKQTCHICGSILVGLVGLGLAATATAAERPVTTTQPPTYTSPATSSANAAPADQVQSGSAQAAMDSSISQARIEDLIGKEVLNVDGQSIGEVKEIARDRDDQSLRMIVATGGVLGVGERRMALPVAGARMEDDRVHLTQSLSEQQMQQDIASYDKANYLEVTEQEREETVAAVATGAASG